jgi:hypothetical protein
MGGNTMSEVDLSKLGLSDFMPYVVERNSLWVLLPLVSFILVLWHLKKHTPPAAPKGGHFEDNLGEPYDQEQQ